MNPYVICQHSIELLIKDPALGNNLTALAKTFELSPSHYQKMFKQYVGVSPKQFQQALLVNHAKTPLLSHSVLDTSEQLNLSSPSRLHDAFVTIEALSPGEFKSQGEALKFRYSRHDTVFGPMLVVMSERGIFYLGFLPTASLNLDDMKLKYPKAQFTAHPDNQLLPRDPFLTNQPIHLHVSATNYQVQVWRALLETDLGDQVSYKHLANKIGHPKGARSVGQAVGANPVAFLIPCHRVIKQSGAISGYRWGVPIKQRLLAWEQARRIHTE